MQQINAPNAGTPYFDNAKKLATASMQCAFLYALLGDLARTEKNLWAFEARIFALLTEAENDFRSLKFPVGDTVAAMLAWETHGEVLAYRATILSKFANERQREIFAHFLTGSSHGV
jgi:hypothetical protein